MHWLLFGCFRTKPACSRVLAELKRSTFLQLPFVPFQSLESKGRSSVDIEKFSRFFYFCFILKGIWTRQFAFLQTKPNLTPWPLRSSSSSQNTGQWQDLHTSDPSIAPFIKFKSITMLFLFSPRYSESILEQSFRAELLAFEFSSSSHLTWWNHDPLSDCASVVFLCFAILSVVFPCFFRFLVLFQRQYDFR